MRKTIKIVGVGDRRQGMSKTGKPYDFTPVHFCYEQPWIRGFAAASCNVSQDCIKYRQRAAGRSWNMETTFCHQR